MRGSDLYFSETQLSGHIHNGDYGLVRCFSIGADNKGLGALIARGAAYSLGERDAVSID